MNKYTTACTCLLPTLSMYAGIMGRPNREKRRKPLREAWRIAHQGTVNSEHHGFNSHTTEPPKRLQLENKPYRKQERAVPSSQAVSHSPLPWLRGVGFFSIVIGGLGLMPAFFWPSVSFFYLGLVVLSVDLWFEPLARSWKIAMWLVCLLVGGMFLFAVVLRRNPISITYRVTDTNLVELYITNASDKDDYQDADLTISTNSLNAYFDKLRNLSEFPSLTVVDPGWKLAHMETTLIYSDGVDYHMTRPTLRVRCSLLPRRSSVHVLLSVVKGSPSGVVPALDWNTLTINGSIKGRFKEFEVSEGARHEQ